MHRPPIYTVKPIKPYEPFAAKARRISTVQIGVCLLLVVFMSVISLLFTRDVVATHNLRSMARSYYENYFYERFASGRTGAELTDAFQPYATTGFRPTTLRQLLTFDGGRFAAQEDDFADCHKINTTVKITPTAPYGAGDYHLETTLVCDFK
jgi:hypothetical protein